MKFLTCLLGLTLSLSLLGCGEKPTPVTAPPGGQGGLGAGAALEPLRILGFNQDSTTAGQPFNVQSDGSSGITFELSRPAPTTGVKAWFDNRPLTGVVARDMVVTATIPADYLLTPGEYPLELEIPDQPDRLPAGNFIVLAR